VYPDPDRLDVSRGNIGIHFCLGAQLARIEAAIAIASLLRRFPSLCSMTSMPLNGVRVSLLRGLVELPASW
jgi:cytochrome P450